MSNYDDSEKGGYSYAEKLALVAKGMMDPHDIGMTSADDAIYEITGLKKAPLEPFFGDWITFEASIVPLDIRAKWAYQDLKVVPPNRVQWESEWKEEHKDEFHIQCIIRSGNEQARLDQVFTDPVLGFSELMRRASLIVSDRYEQIKKENTGKSYKTRDDLAAEKRDEIRQSNTE